MMFFNEKNWKDSIDFSHRKVTLKFLNLQISNLNFKSDVGLTKIFLDKKVLFSIQVTYGLIQKVLKNS